MPVLCQSCSATIGAFDEKCEFCQEPRPRWRNYTMYSATYKEINLDDMIAAMREARDRLVTDAVSLPSPCHSEETAG